jgi:transposase-like protein
MAATLTYRQRRRAGMITVRRARIPAHVRNTVPRRYLAREKTQTELALEYGISQSTVARLVENWEFYSSGGVPPKLRATTSGEDC